MGIIEMEWVQLYAKQQLSQYELNGLHYVKLHQGRLPWVDALVLTMTAACMGEDAGDPVISTTTERWVVRPWWLPKFLWNRLTWTELVRKTTHQPKWIYPSSNIKVPELGSARPTILVTEHNDEW